MTSVDYSPQPDYRSRSSHSTPPAPPKGLLSATWHVLEQPPPPTLREILSAYRTRGDGDREMLMAMLNAKSAEDQRISSIAALHRTMLDYYQVMPDSPRQQSSNAPYLENSHPHPNTLPPLQPFPPPSSAHSSPRMRREAPESSTSAARPSKRSRTSHSPPSGHRSTASNPSPAPSPRSLHSPSYSSTRSDSADHSPRSQGAMAIDSLLSAHSSREELSSSSTSSKRSVPHTNGVPEYTSAIRGGPSRPSSSSVAAVSG